ncbi:MAG TPA: APC family permease [Methanoregulaceae archaeon]|nr:APC family permease [Methanoregulaceae archaeon]HPD75781.1 APC family permease [Methanoregulaceae archaeon]HRY75326.1 APC family permease [Methanoregulaceae archaeon]
MAAESPKASLRRELNLFDVTVSGIGIILGAGVYVLIGQAAGLCGNAVWLAFAVSALMALVTGLSYAELSSMFPRAGAEYDYVRNAFDARLAFVTGWLVFLSGVLAAATVALGFGGYFNVLTGVPVFASALVLLVLLTALLAYGIRETVRVAVVATLIEAAGLVIIIAIGLPHLGSVNYLELPQGIPGLFAAAALIFFAYQGFESMVKFSEETKVPESTIPRALLLALTISTVLYILVALAAVSVLSWEQLAVSGAPFADIVAATLGPEWAALIAVIALFATANTVLMSMYASIRLLFGMAVSSSLSAGLAYVHPGRRTPIAATVACGILTVALIFLGDIAFIANVTNFTLFVTFIMINAAVIALRYHSPGADRAFRVPGSLGRLPVLPVVGILLCVLLLGVQDRSVLALGAVLTGIGVVLLLVSGWRATRRTGP